MGILFSNDGKLQRHFVVTTDLLVSMQHNFGVLHIDTANDVTLTLSDSIAPGFTCTVVQKSGGRANIITALPSLDLASVNSKYKSAAAGDTINIYSPQPGKFVLQSSGAAGGGQPPAYMGTQLVSGNATWAGNLNFDVTNCSYYILGTLYNSLATVVVLDAADPDNPRIDVIYLDTDGNVGVIAGTPAASPVAPVVDPSTQIPLTFVLIATNATVPSNIVNLDIYKENLEWTGSTNVPGVDFEYPGDPQQGGVSILVPPVTKSDNITFTAPPSLIAINVYDYSYLKMYVKVAEPAPDAVRPPAAFKVLLANDAAIVGQPLLVTPAYGFDSYNYEVWQLITIPLSDIIFTNPNVNKFQIFFDNATFNDLQFDNIYLQGRGPVSGGGGGDFIPLAGTEPGKPVTGDIENNNGYIGQFYRSENGNNAAYIFDPVNDPNGVDLIASDGTYVAKLLLQGGGCEISNNNGTDQSSLKLLDGNVNVDGTGRGLAGTVDFSEKIEDLDYTQKIYVDKLRPYKVYVATLTQEGGADPVAIVHENTLRLDIGWTRALSGVYVGLLANAFTENKTFLLSNAYGYGVVSLQCVDGDEDRISLRVAENDGVTLHDGFTVQIEIRVYN